MLFHTQPHAHLCVIFERSHKSYDILFHNSRSNLCQLIIIDVVTLLYFCSFYSFINLFFLSLIQLIWKCNWQSLKQYLASYWFWTIGKQEHKWCQQNFIKSRRWNHFKHHDSLPLSYFYTHTYLHCLQKVFPYLLVFML